MVIILKKRMVSAGLQGIFHSRVKEITFLLERPQRAKFVPHN